MTTGQILVPTIQAYLKKWSLYDLTDLPNVYLMLLQPAYNKNYFLNHATLIDYNCLFLKQIDNCLIWFVFWYENY